MSHRFKSLSQSSFPLIQGSMSSEMRMVDIPTTLSSFPLIQGSMSSAHSISLPIETRRSGRHGLDFRRNDVQAAIS